MGPFGCEGGVVHDGGADVPNEVVACLFVVSLREGVGELFVGSVPLLLGLDVEGGDAVVVED